jgi:exodeoxyribonuclease VII small subunit
VANGFTPSNDAILPSWRKGKASIYTSLCTPRRGISNKGYAVAKKKGEPFEEALKKLQMIVEKLEKGDLPLEEAMESFTEGIKLAQYCHQKLEEAENKVQMLLKDPEGSWSVVPFEPTTAKNSNE